MTPPFLSEVCVSTVFQMHLSTWAHTGRVVYIFSLLNLILLRVTLLAMGSRRKAALLLDEASP